MMIRARPVEANETLRMTIDGAEVPAGPRDSLLSAILRARGRLSVDPATGAAVTGFCLMGACQRCWLWTEDGLRVRACTTPAADGLTLSTSLPSPDATEVQP